MTEQEAIGRTREALERWRSARVVARENGFQALDYQHVHRRLMELDDALMNLERFAGTSSEARSLATDVHHAMMGEEA